jgi:hypothetical protein
MRGLKVPGKWLSQCGKGNEDRVFPVKSVRQFQAADGSPITIVRVDDDGYDWTVIAELRGTEFVEL